MQFALVVRKQPKGGHLDLDAAEISSFEALRSMVSTELEKGTLTLASPPQLYGTERTERELDVFQSVLIRARKLNWARKLKVRPDDRRWKGVYL
jgi:hypothetical protein